MTEQDEAKLLSILEYYQKTFNVSSDDAEACFNELLMNEVEVHGDSFYCEIEQDNGIIVLLAGTKDRADLWVLKKIIKLIKSGREVLSMLNGNSEYLLKKLSRYDLETLNRESDVSYIAFNRRK